jgi:hypothetical protein
MKIISGGQTGVDRAALDAALKHHLQCGGWCPDGRLDEFGRIPEHYPVRELSGAGPAERTRQNVIDSEATIIMYEKQLRSGTEFTVQCCEEYRRPHLLIDAAKTSTDVAAKLISEFVRQRNVGTLNVAGPRQSDWSGGYDYCFRTLELFLAGRRTQ